MRWDEMERYWSNARELVTATESKKGEDKLLLFIQKRENIIEPLHMKYILNIT